MRIPLLLAFFIGAISILNSGPVFIGSASAQEKSTIDFNRDIKPILSDRCFQCHGPDEQHRQADLRLDLAKSALDSAIVPGKPDSSDLLDRILSDDPDTVMPPPDANKKKLTAAEIMKLRTWIEQGARYEGHWAYQKVVRPQLPKLDKLAEWGQQPIDRFVAAKLEAAKKEPSKPADRRVLIRRLYFDLTGLPPSPKQVENFVNDKDPRAFEKVVDELLASEAYGERMAVYWLDQVRYADTNGIHGDNHRDHSLFRDYVIDAFNSNQPFDQFTVEQLAGDLLPDRNNRQWIASGYNRLNMTTREGGAQPKEYRAKYAADRVRNASVVWMGSTLGCAECHDHKYDPFKSKDFYRFAAFFSDIEEVAVGAQPPVKLPSPEQETELARIEKELADARQELGKRNPQRTEQFEAFLAEQKVKLGNTKPVWNPIVPTNLSSSGGATLVTEKDVVKSSGKNPAKDNYSITLKPESGKITGFRLEVLTDKSFPNQSVGRGNGNIVLTNVIVKQGKKPVKISKALADFSQPNHDISLAIDKRGDTGWAVSGHTQKQNRTAVFVFEKPVVVGDSSELTIELKHESIYAQHNIGKFRISLTDALQPSLNDSRIASPGIVALLNKTKRTPADKKQLYQFFVDQSEAMKVERGRVQALQKKKVAIEKSFRPILVTKTTRPRMTRVLPRGNWLDDSGPIVAPGVPSFLTQIPTNTEKDKPADRYDLARWIVDKNNPLTARVFVNRLWKIAFGEGIVRTPDDFGSQGAVPTHPELLDYLAVEFVESGWNVKKLVKSIAMSRTYQQTSIADENSLKEDPGNLLLSRQNRFRLDAEFVRDNALSISGLLVRQVGGNSVKPYQPAGYWQHLNFPRRTYQHSKDQNQYRRGLYSYWCRTFLHPSLSVFDAPTREESCVQRPRSNTPLQALVLLNDPSYVESAQAFAERIMLAAKDQQSRLSFAYSEALNRRPTDRESKILMALYEKHKQEFSKDTESAKKSIQTGLRKAPQKLDPIELAAWTSVARIILNLHETITRY